MSDTTGFSGTTIIVLRRKRRTSLIRKTGWLLFKLAMLGWSIAIMIVPPTAVFGLYDTIFHYAWTSLSALGAVLGAVGIILSMNPDLYFVRKYAVPVELAGLSSMAIGPFVYFLTQLNLMLSDLPDSFQQRFALTWFSLSMLMVVAARLLMVAPRLHREK